MAKIEDRNRPALLKYAYLKNMQETLEELKCLAVEEQWDYSLTTHEKPLPILYSYLMHTFARVEEQKKIMASGNYSCFDTGLTTKNQQEIFMIFKKNTRGFYFLEFAKESDSNMGRFSALPERATYFNEPSELIYDPRLDLRINIDHIIDDEENFKRFSSDIQELPKLQLINTLNGAIEHAKKRVKRNYKTAIPQFFRGRGFAEGRLQLLLPLCLKDSSKADLALAIFKCDGFYSGKTCLTLDMAINNARLIAKPDDEWLKP